MTSSTKPGRRTGKRLVLVLASLALALGACELGLRWILFGQEQAAWELRHPQHFTRGPLDDDYWLLLRRMRPYLPLPRDTYHPELGWVSAVLDVDTLEHRAAPHLRGRRPLLFYGDSYTHCTTGSDRCFEGLLDRSEQSGDWALLNHGVQGYGVDQMTLLLEATLERYLDRDPVVALGIYVDEDLDRSAMRIYQYPRPLAHLDEAGALQPEPGPVPTLAEFEAATPIGIRSYLWRYLRFGTTLFGKSRASAERTEIERRSALNRAWLDRARALLVERGVEHFAVLFLGEHVLDANAPPSWQETFLLDYAQRTGLPLVTTRRDLEDDARESGRRASAYFGRSGPLAKHLTAAGNIVAFRTLLRGLRGEFDRPR